MTTLAPPRRTKPRGFIRPFLRLGLLLGLVALTGWVGLRRDSLHAAETAFSKGDRQNAIRLALDDLRIFRWSRASALIAARALSLELYPDEAEPYYKRAERSGPLPVEAQRDRLQALVRAGQNEKAVSLALEVLKQYLDDPTTLRYLATVEWSEGHVQEARDAAQRLVKTAEGQVDGYDFLALIERLADRRERAVAASEALLQIDPELKRFRGGRAEVIAFWASLADDLIGLKRSAEAKDYLLRQITPFSDPMFHDILGSAELQMGDPNAAQAAWRESIRRNPKRMNPWLRLGNLMLSTKRYAEAVEILENAVAIAPDFLEANYQLGRAYQFMDRPADAQRVFKIAAELKRTSPVQPGAMRPSP